MTTILDAKGNVMDEPLYTWAVSFLEKPVTVMIVAESAAQAEEKLRRGGLPEGAKILAIRPAAGVTLPDDPVVGLWPVAGYEHLLQAA